MRDYSGYQPELWRDFLRERLGRPMDKPTTPEQRLGAGLRTAREAAGLSQEEAGRTMGWYAHTIARIERGVQNVTVLELTRLCISYGVSPNSLLDWEEHLITKAPTVNILDEVGKMVAEVAARRAWDAEARAVLERYATMPALYQWVREDGSPNVKASYRCADCRAPREYGEQHHCLRDEARELLARMPDADPAG